MNAKSLKAKKEPGADSFVKQNDVKGYLKHRYRASESQDNQEMFYRNKEGATWHKGILISHIF